MKLEDLESVVRSAGMDAGLMSMGAASCIYSEGCSGVIMDDFLKLVASIEAPAQAQINSLRDEVERLKREAQERALQYLSDNGQWIEEVARLTKERDEARALAATWDRLSHD